MYVFLTVFVSLKIKWLDSHQTHFSFPCLVTCQYNGPIIPEIGFAPNPLAWIGTGPPPQLQCCILDQTLKLGQPYLVRNSFIPAKQVGCDH